MEREGEEEVREGVRWRRKGMTSSWTSAPSTAHLTWGQYLYTILSTTLISAAP